MNKSEDPETEGLTPAERDLILKVQDRGAVAFRIAKDPALAGLLDRGLVDVQLLDTNFALLFLTQPGHVAAARLRQC